MAQSSRLPGTPCTPAQAAQLLALHRLGAVSAETGAAFFDFKDADAPCNPTVLGALRDKGLANSRVVRSGGGRMAGQFTAYWLTVAGVAEADKLATTGAPA